MGRYYIDKYTGTLERTDLYLVRLIKKDGTVIEDLEPRMLFPITNQVLSEYPLTFDPSLQK